MAWAGFHSDMEGAKAIGLAGMGHGGGGGLISDLTISATASLPALFEDGTIGRWRDDALAVIDQLTEGSADLGRVLHGGVAGLSGGLSAA